MKNTYFLTGYPGFLATSLIRQLIHDHQDIEHIHLLVLPNQESKAYEEIKSFAQESSIPENFFSIVTGDITKQGLAISESVNQSLKLSVTHVFHLAAIYDLAVPKVIAYDVNVNGTQNVNNWVKTLDGLSRYIYFSTAYVSGAREGKIYEHELSEGQSFKNHYEQTKYEAELLVDDIKESVPTTIIRPGIVKGNSETGETIKFDGIYFMLNFLEHLRYLPVMTYLGDGEPEGNFVPSDYVLKAVSYLAVAPIGKGKTYHLTDPNPYKMKDLHKMLSEQYLGKTPTGQVPLTLAKKALSIAAIRKWLQVEKEALDYFEFKTSYDCSQAVNDLEGSGIVCPDLKDTVEPMLTYYRKYKHDRSKHIEIR
ncbi:SDR family oxidoreductase [Virgibacillus necropolis]|uniref:3-beta hydroxysteroid dehydrogenase n=1 Tax=Virgibacillus necropolis TaxID=163877 RepID=A0A221MGA6_9BACI|nr:SDR family oxidoreductase [Virgibacillus necropolis]ASN06664.1 3-beta hydroxysteroid dehydrogenase [Virgibacillus necropolis]